MSAKQIQILREAAASRSSALLAYQGSLADMNECVRQAYEAGVPAPVIAEAIGTSRQRVYEILRGVQ